MFEEYNNILTDVSVLWHLFHGQEHEVGKYFGNIR